jgi:hypothetical protein
MRLPATALLLLLAGAARADEGMWTFDGFPAARVEAEYGFRPDARWLEHVRLSSARLAQGCSGGFVSARALVVTNHHCAHECLAALSTPDRDLVARGFLARSAAEERRCPDLEVNQLVAIEDVTARMAAATAGLEGAAFHAAQRAERARIEGECQTSPALRCEVVALYGGGRHALHAYRRHQDVRLVFAPELAIAFFGGDLDNFEFPRFALDVAFLRVWEDGAPSAMEHFLRWSRRGVEEGELVFASGHPGSTSRGLTVAQLEHQRDVALPDALLELAEWRGVLAEYGRRGREQARHSGPELLEVENAYKAYRGEWAALRDRELFARKVREEEAFRAAAARDPALAGEVAAAYDAVAAAQAELARIRLPLRMLERGPLLRSDLFSHARTLLRAAEERPKPSGERLREYREPALPAVTQRLLSPAPIHRELEVLRLTHALEKLRERLGPDDPAVRRALGRRGPAEVAADAVRGTRAGDVAFRRRLWEGGQAAVSGAARDPMLALAAAIDGDARAARAAHEARVEAAIDRAATVLARARFALEGTGLPPDATFTLRLSYGRVAGWEERGRAVPAFTTIGGLLDRATGRDPFALPPSWVAAVSRLDPATPLNLATTNDVVGGSSGSPLVDRDGALVGLVFDGNLHSLGGEYAYDERRNRAVSVDARAILAALSRVYGAEALARELLTPSAILRRP